MLDDTRAVLVPPSAEALAEAVARILADSERAVRFGAAARAYAQGTLIWPRFLESMSNIYRQVHAYARAQAKGLPH